MRLLAVVSAIVAVTAACARPSTEPVTGITPHVSIDRPEAGIGEPLDLTFSFAQSADAHPFDEDAVVIVHFVDRHGRVLWTDDHSPPTPTRQWRRGETTRYTRRVFVPKRPYLGEVFVDVGLYAPRAGVRLALMPPGSGREGSGRLATFRMTLPSTTAFVALDEGWHPTETSGDGQTAWNWSSDTGTFSYRHPHRPVRVFLDLDLPSAAPGGPRRIQLRLGSAVVDEFALAPGQRTLREVELADDQLGTAERVAMTVGVDSTFVPATRPAGSVDARRLGVRVFRIHVETR